MSILRKILCIFVDNNPEYTRAKLSTCIFIDNHAHSRFELFLPKFPVEIGF